MCRGLPITRLPPFATLAKFAVPLVLVGARLCANEVRPSGTATLADLVLATLLAIWIVTVTRGGWRDAMLSVGAVLFCFAGAEAYALVSLSRNPVIESTPGYLLRHPVLGWAMAREGVFRQTKQEAATGRVIYDAEATIDRHHNRQVVSAETGPTVAFFGDSFTFGQGLPDADTLPQAFADLTGRKLRVLNFGISGYGPQQFLRALETGLFDKLLTEPRLFVFETWAGHAERSACVNDFMRRAPRYVLTDGRVELRGICEDRWRPWLGRVFSQAMYSVFLQPALSGADRAAIDLYIAILARARQLARERYHVPTVILYLPNPDYLRGSGITDAQIEQRLRDSGLIVVEAGLDQSAFPGQPLQIPDDGHPTGVANRARAAILHDAIGTGD